MPSSSSHSEPKLIELLFKADKELDQAFQENRVESIIHCIQQMIRDEFSLNTKCEFIDETLEKRLQVEIENRVLAKGGKVPADKFSNFIVLENGKNECIGKVWFASEFSSLSPVERRVCEHLIELMSRKLSQWKSTIHVQSELENLRGAKYALDEKIQQLELLYDFERSFAENLEVENFLLKISERLKNLAQASGVIIMYRKEKETSINFLSHKQNTFINLSDKAKFFAQSFDIKIKSGFRSKELSQIVGTEVNNHVGVPFHFLETADGGSREVWGRVELINHPASFDDQDLGFLNIVAEKVSAAISRDSFMKHQASSQRLATIGQLSSTIVHDFKNPMTSIRGFAELLKLNGESMTLAQKEKIYGIIMNQVDRCTNMIEELLSFARGNKSYSFEECDINGFLEEIVDLIQLETDKQNIVLETNFDFDGNANIDRDKMMRVILNLTNNAIEILDKGQKLRITSQEKPDGELEIAVEDTGPGVPPELKSSLFNAFVTEGKETGTGLGLHISKEIVEAHKGQLFLDESYKGGARFIISLPIHSDSAIQAS